MDYQLLSHEFPWLKMWTSRATFSIDLPWLYAIFVCFFAAKTSFAGVLISEIMYHPASENPRESYVEL
jgi:hypothetical protein